MSDQTRRHFLGTSATLATAAATSTWAAAQDAPPLVVGVIGTGGMGRNHLKQLATRKEVKIAYICDPDANALGQAAKVVKDGNGTEPKAVKDLRTVLDDKVVDAVFIATADHWHGPAAILACQAGKHVYVEKPCSHNIREGRLMVEAARKSNKVMQVGTQSRSTEYIQKAMQLIKEGVIGEVMVAKAWNSQLRRNIGHAKPSKAPESLDYDLWLGPVPEVPFQVNRANPIWRWWYDFGTGDMGNDGVHQLDVARWGLGVDSHPSYVAASGGKFFFDDDQQFPDTQYVVFDYPGDGKIGHRKQLIYEQRIWSPYHQENQENGNAFYGTKGVLTLGSQNGWKVTLAKNQAGPTMAGSPSLTPHHQNFIDCVRNGKKPNCDIEEGHQSAALAHLGNIAVRVGRSLKFDPKNEQVIGDEEANKLVRRQYRDGHWAVPKGV